MQEDTFRWVITGAVVLSTLFIFAMAIALVAMYGILSKLKVKVESVTQKAEPLLDKLQRVAAKVEPLVERAESVAAKTEPLIATATGIARENAPKISEMITRFKEIVERAKDITESAREIAKVGKDQALRFAEVGSDIADRAKVQVARVDMVVDETVTQAQHVGDGVKEVVMKPVREASGVVAGIRAAVSTFAAGQRPAVNRVAQDEEMFI